MTDAHQIVQKMWWMCIANVEATFPGSSCFNSTGTIQKKIGGQIYHSNKDREYNR